MYKEPEQTQIEKVSEWVAQLDYEDIPIKVIDLAKLQVLDALSAIAAGSRTPMGRQLKNALEATGSNGQTTVLPTGDKWPIESVLFYHSAMITALEMDNFSFMGHITQSAVTVPLALGEKLGKNGKEMLLAVVAAQEVAGRMSAHLASGPQQGHMRSFIHRVAGTVAASKLYNLTSATIAQALAIVLSMPEYPLYPACFSPDTKVLCTGSPTVASLQAVNMAKEGISGPLDILENPVGFFTYLSYLNKPPNIWGHIGESWSIYPISFKKYATCAYSQGPVNAALELRGNSQFSIDDIERIDIYGPLVTVVMEKFSKPHYKASYTRVNTNFSTVRSVLACLLFGPLDGDFFEEGSFENKISKIEPFIPKTFLHHSWQQTLDLIKGMDGGIAFAGRPGIFSFGYAGKTLHQFKEAFGSRPLFSWADLPQILKLNRADRFYLLNRFWKAYRVKLPFLNKKKRDAYRSYEGDLSQTVFALSGKVKLKFKDGTVQEAFCKIPPGFAGDPNRKEVVERKFFRETIPVFGKEKAEKIRKSIHQLPEISISKLLRAFEGA